LTFAPNSVIFQALGFTPTLRFRLLVEIVFDIFGNDLYRFRGGKFMSWTTYFRRSRSLLFSVTVVGAAAVSLWYGATLNNTSANQTTTSSHLLASQPAATFAGANVGAIPDAATGNCWGAFVPTPRNVTFNVTGLSGAPTNVELSTTFGGQAHTWVGDVRATLIAPNAASHLIFARTGGTTSGASGDSSDLAGPYNFKDSAAGVNWWTEAANRLSTEALTAGDYRTTTAGGAAGGGTNTSMTPAFAGVADPNGTWTLRLEDGCAGDSGSISAATLTIDSGPAVAADAPVDYNGDGRSDFVVVRNTGGGAGGQVTWFVNIAGTATTTAFEWGLSTDFFVPEDYDGDDKDDYAIWRVEGGSGTFYIHNSSNSTVRIESFGIPGDDPSVIGDYNNDGSADLAVYRAGAMAGDQSTWFYRTTPNGPVNAVPWGINGDFPAPGDYDGDGSNDFVIQRNNGGGQARFWRALSSGMQDSLIFGTPTDVIVPGDYDLDGKTDIAVIRGVGGQIRWFYEPSSMAGVQVVQNTWGNSATDFPTQGDYDGDGRTDLGIWRPSATPGQTAFWYFSLQSSTANAVPFGSNGDYPVANYNSH
jgi:hypothetical protein